MYPLIKRCFDVIFSAALIIVLSPLLVLISLLLRFSGEGYVFYKQRRIGFQNRYFNIIKFATMLKDSPNIGTGEITLRNDPRLLPMGKFLRKSKLNEVPQIFNVLFGDMSFVGPRPLVDRTFNAYPEDLRKKVYDSKPGITGIGSVVFRDEEGLISASKLPPHEFYKSQIAPYKGALEIWYNRNKSFSVDLAILFLTVWVIFNPSSKLPHRVFRDLPKNEIVYHE